MSKLSVSQINNATNERITIETFRRASYSHIFLFDLQAQRTHMMTTIAEPSNNVL